MTRYHVDTPARLVLVQVALDQSFGLRDIAGNPTPREQFVGKPSWGGRLVRASEALGPNHQCYDWPGTNWPLIDGGDGTAVLEIRQAIDDRIDRVLGTTVNGVALPRVADLVQVMRPRDNSLLPAGVRDKLDDAYVSSQLDGTDAAGQPKDTPAARAAISAELQGRAAAVLARKDARGAKVAAADTGGGGKSGGK